MAVRPRPRVHWLATVESLGYPLSEAEARLSADCRRQPDEQTAELAGEDEDSDGAAVEELGGEAADTGG